MRFWPFLIVLVLLWSCQKETSAVLGTTDGSSADSTNWPSFDTSTRLVKMVYREDGTGFTDTFLYDSVGRLAQWRVTNNATGASSTSLDYYDAEGRLYKTQVAGDSVYTLISYQSALSNNIVAIISKSSNNGLLLDSIAYSYTNNHVKKRAHFSFVAGKPVPAQSTFYETWDYDARGNAIGLQWYNLDSGTYKLNFRYEFQFDDKINPLQFGAAFLSWNWSTTSPNNMVQQKNFYPDGTTEVLTTTYEYRLDGRPTVAHFSDGAQRTAEIFYYYNK